MSNVLFDAQSQDLRGEELLCIFLNVRVETQTMWLFYSSIVWFHWKAKKISLEEHLQFVEPYLPVRHRTVARIPPSRELLVNPFSSQDARSSRLDLDQNNINGDRDGWSMELLVDVAYSCPKETI